MHITSISKKLCILALGLTLLSGCSHFGKDKEISEEQQANEAVERIDKERAEHSEHSDGVDKVYNKAAQALDTKNYAKAAQLFDEVEREYPYSQWATRAQLMAGYSHYRDLAYDDAILALDRFIQLHPGDDNIAYAFYLRALCYYEQISDVRRDQKMTEFALDNLSQITQRFPDSKYARDAALKIDLTLDHLAGKEMEIGRYYLIRGHYHAAINRFSTVLNEYQTTTHVPEALHRLTEAYLAIGIRPEAEKTASILGYNYPASQWYKDSYALLTGKTASAEIVTPKKPSMYDRTLGKIF